MRNFLLTKIRLSTYFWFFFVLFFGLSFVLPQHQFAAGALTLFSVNSFLYGFYISPILGAQKMRIDSLHQCIRSEANALFGLVLNLKKLPDDKHKEIQEMVVKYATAKWRNGGVAGGEKEYEDLIGYCVDAKQDKDKLEETLKALVANQQNRTTFSMLAGGKVFANEWHIVAILFSITLGFIMLIDAAADGLILHVVRALLCTGLTMLIVNLVKLSTLTHKKAKQMWEPLQKLVSTNFYRVD